MIDEGSNQTILVTGANGFLGQHLCWYLVKRGFHVIATGRGERRLSLHDNIIYHNAELINEQEVKQMMEVHQPDVVVHTAAMSKPDECNNNRTTALKVNVDATTFLLDHPAQHFIYISTDFVFGEDGPHAEEDPTGPLNFYGETKLLAEAVVRNSGLPYTIIRPVFIYGKILSGMRSSFLHWVKTNLEEGKKIKVVSDQLRTPTYVEDICRGIYTVITKKSTGHFHLAGKEVLSPYHMAMITANILNLDSSLIEQVTSETFPEPVIRAKRSGLKIDKAIKELAYNPVSFEEGVRLTFSIQ